MVDRICDWPGCNTKLNSYNRSGYCYAHQSNIKITRGKASENLRGGVLESEEVREYAQFYGYAQDEQSSLRRFEEHIRGEKGTRVIEITFDRDSSRYIFHSQPGEMRGPLADTEEKVMVPPGTTMVQISVCSGEVSGKVYQGIITSGLQRPWIVLKGEDGCSGIGVKLDPSSR